MPLYRMIPIGRIFEQVCANVLHFSTEQDIDPLGIAGIVRDIWLPTVRNLQNANFVWFQIVAQKMTPDPGPQLILAFPNQPGSLSGAGAHPSLCALMSLRAACAGRQCRGRIYIPGVHGESVQNGKVEPNALAAYNQVAGLIKDRFTREGSFSANIALVIAPRANPANFKEVVQVIARPTFGIQRRRNIGVGS